MGLHEESRTTCSPHFLTLVDTITEFTRISSSTLTHLLPRVVLTTLISRSVPSAVNPWLWVMSVPSAVADGFVLEIL
jgi:hypothetical protein